MNNPILMRNLRNIPDFPIPGIIFRDVTTLFKDANCLRIMLDELYEIYKDKGITKVVGIESRGFILGPALAIRLGAGFVMCRKPGKLPAETIYGTDTIEIHKDSINKDDVVLLHDDLLATGGSMRATWNLVKKFSPKSIYINFIIELTDEGLHGRQMFEEGTDIQTLITI